MSFFNFSGKRPFDDGQDLLKKYHEATDTDQRLKLLEAFAKYYGKANKMAYGGVSHALRHELYIRAINSTLNSKFTEQKRTIGEIQRRTEQHFKEQVFYHQFKQTKFKQIGLDNLLILCNEIPFPTYTAFSKKSWWFAEEIFNEAREIALRKLRARLLDETKGEIKSVVHFFFIMRRNAYLDLLKKQRGGQKEEEIQKLQEGLDMVFAPASEPINVAYLQLLDALQNIPNIEQLKTLSDKALSQIFGKLQGIGLDFTKRLRELINMEEFANSKCLKILLLNANGVSHVDIFQMVFDDSENEDPSRKIRDMVYNCKQKIKKLLSAD